MTQKKRSGAKSFVPIGFNILASLLIFFILLPLLLTLLSTSVGTLLQTLQDQVVIDSISLTFKAGPWRQFWSLLLGVPIAYLLARSDFLEKPSSGDHRPPTVITPALASPYCWYLVVRAFLKAFAHRASLLPTDWLGSLSRCFLSVCHCWSTHPDSFSGS